MRPIALQLDNVPVHHWGR